MSHMETMTDKMHSLTAEKESLQQQVATLTAASSAAPYVPTEVAEQLLAVPQTPPPNVSECVQEP